MRWVLLSWVVICGVVVAQKPVEKKSPFERGAVTVDGRELKYRLLAPARVEEGRRYPLILFLHGRGECGDDNEKQLLHFAGTMGEKERRDRYPCFLLAPQCPADTSWNDVDWAAMKACGPTAEPLWSQRAVIEALKGVVRSRPVDTDRIYLTGLSMGGFGAWDLACRHPDWFAACVPVCGGGEPASARRLVGLPVWAWHGAEDDVVPPTASRKMVAALRGAGAEVRFDELEGVGHDSWSAAYGEDGVLDWLFERRRGKTRPSAGLAMLARTDAIRSGERVAFLGDSITESGARAGGYVKLIESVLAGRDDLDDVVVIGAGISGHKVPDLEQRLDRDVLDKGATLVFIYIGINDVWHSEHGKGTPADVFEAGLGRLVERIEKSGATVILATPTTIGERARGTNRLDSELEKFAAIGRRVATEKDVYLMDLRREMTDYLAVLNGGDRPQGVLTGDGVHLNAAGNRFLADRAARAVVEALERRAAAK